MLDDIRVDTKYNIIESNGYWCIRDGEDYMCLCHNEKTARYIKRSLEIMRASEIQQEVASEMWAQEWMDNNA
jgi:hypothetical protein